MWTTGPLFCIMTENRCGNIVKLCVMMADFLRSEGADKKQANLPYLTLSCRVGCETKDGELKRCVKFVEASQAEDERVESHCGEAVRAEASHSESLCRFCTYGGTS